MADEKELQQLKKRLLELAGRSYEHGIYTFTPFLGLSEQQAFYEIQRDLAYAGTGIKEEVELPDLGMEQGVYRKNRITGIWQEERETVDGTGIQE